MSKHIVAIKRLAKPLTLGNQSRLSQSVGANFQPWFLPRSTYKSIVQLIPREYLIKMRDYFERYGCMRCEKRKAIYGQNGMCKLCYSEVGRRLRRCLKARFGDPKKRASTVQLNEVVAGTNMARKLLRDLVPAIQATSPSQQKYNARNPAISIRA